MTVSDLKRELPSTQLALYGLTAPLGTDEKAYAAQVLSYSNYYAFGMSMPGRNKESQKYRYGYNGQEKENELSFSVTSAEYWIYDSKVARRWNIDPVLDESESPYAVFKNSPIALNDPFGDCPDCKPGDYEGQTRKEYAHWYSVAKTKYHWYSGGDEKSKAGWKEAEEYTKELSKHINIFVNENSQIGVSTDVAFERIEEGVFRDATRRAIDVALPSTQVFVNIKDEQDNDRYVQNPNFAGHGITSLYDPALVFPWGRLLGFTGKSIKSVFAFTASKAAVKTSTTVMPRAVGAAPKGFSTVLQSGGHTLNNSTLKALGLTKEQGKIAVEALKSDLRLPANFHGKIMGNGDLVHPHTREVLGNLFDYLH